MNFQMRVRRDKGDLEWRCSAPSVEDGVAQFEAAVLAGEFEGVSAGEAMAYEGLEIGWAGEPATRGAGWD